MNLLELLHNEKVVKQLEQIDANLSEIIEPNGDFSVVWPSIVFMLEMFLSKANKSDVADIIFKKRNKDIIQEKIKQLNYDIDDIKYKIDLLNADVDEIDSFSKGAYDTKDEVEKIIIDLLDKQLIKNKKLNYGKI